MSSLGLLRGRMLDPSVKNTEDRDKEKEAQKALVNEYLMNKLGGEHKVIPGISTDKSLVNPETAKASMSPSPDYGSEMGDVDPYDKSLHTLVTKTKPEDVKREKTVDKRSLIQSSLQAKGKLPIEEKQMEKEITPLDEAKQERNLRMLFAGLSEAGQDVGAAIAGIKSDPSFWKEQRGMADKDYQRVIDKANKQEDRKFQMEKARVSAMIKASSKGLEGLSAKDTMTMSEGKVLPKLMGDLHSVIENNIKYFGPIKGREASYNPYNTTGQTINARMRAVSQTFGRYMEGGVLRKEDEEKYRKMFPQLSDTPEVAENKLTNVENLLREKHAVTISALNAQGYDTSGLNIVDRAKESGLIPKDSNDAPPVERVEIDPSLAGEDIVQEALVRAKKGDKGAVNFLKLRQKKLDIDYGY